MIKNKSILTIIDEAVSDMRYSGLVSSVATTGANWTITTVNNADLEVGEYVTIGSARYNVLSKVDYRTFVVSGSTTPNGSTWTCEAPYFYHGTPIDVNKEHADAITTNEMKYPIICLFEPIESDFYFNPSERIGETTNLWLAFMTDADHATYSPNDYHSNCISDMQELMIRFMTSLHAQPGVIYDETQSFNKIEHLKFGLIAKTKGTEKYLLNDNLSGIELTNVRIQIEKEYDC